VLAALDAAKLDVKASETTIQRRIERLKLSNAPMIGLHELEMIDKRLNNIECLEGGKVHRGSVQAIKAIDRRVRGQTKFIMGQGIKGSVTDPRLAAFKKRNEICLRADNDTLFVTSLMDRPGTMGGNNRGALSPVSDLGFSELDNHIDEISEDDSIRTQDKLRFQEALRQHCKPVVGEHVSTTKYFLSAKF